jgi:hypothetical protein
MGRKTLEGSQVLIAMRSMLTASLLACLLGCPAAEDEKAETDQVALMGELRFVEQDSYTVIAGGRVSLAVRLVDGDGEPIADQQVEFGLTGSPEGASLEAVYATTDAEGIATTVLYAGRASTPFRVRASADGLTPIHFSVTVGAAPSLSVNVSLEYDGDREITSHTVVIVEGMSCDQVRSNPNDVRMSRTVPVNDPPLAFYPGAGRSYAIAAWGSDETNSKLAWGCKAYSTPLSDAEPSEPPKVTLEDIPFTATAAIPLSFTLNLKPVLAGLAPLARSAVTAALPATSTPQASFLLDLMQARVNIAAARRNDNLDAALQQLLDAASAGPLRFADALADEVSKDGSMCMLQGALTPVDERNMKLSSLTLSPPVFALPSDSLAKDLSLSEVALKGVLEFNASYLQEEAAVDVRALKIGLGFGSYATYLSRLVELQPERYRARTGCTELQNLVTQRAASFAGLSASDAGTECTRGYDALFVSIRQLWTALNQQRHTISFAPGKLPAHDRDGDRNIDDLGPAQLTGSWATGANVVTGTASALAINVRTAPAWANVR